LLTQRCDRLSSQTLQAGLEQTPQTLSPPTPNR
jgi:hypothetical protein